MVQRATAVTLGALVGCQPSVPHVHDDGGDAAPHLHDVAAEVDVDLDVAHVHDTVDDAHSVDVGVTPRDASPSVDSRGADAGRDTTRDLTVRLEGWGAERGRRMELRLLDPRGGLTSLAVLRAVSSGSERFVFEGAAGAGAATLAGFVDRDGDERFGDGDGSFRLEVPRSPPYSLTLGASAAHGDPVALPADRVDLGGHLVGFEVHQGVRFELSVTASGSDAVAGLYRDEAMTGSGTLDLRLPRALRPGVEYTVRFFIDLNDNGVYDPRGDHGASITGTATDRGLRLGHDHHGNRTWWE